MLATSPQRVLPAHDRDREPWDVARFAAPRHGFQPQCDCYRTDDPPAVHLLLELPGIDPAEVQIVAAGTALVVFGVRERPHPAGARYHQFEIEYGPFERSIELAAKVDVDAVAVDLRSRDAAAGGAAAMNEIEFAETQPTQVDEIPAELPVLPLKETVVFPDSMSPLAIGQERSIRLVDDVVAATACSRSSRCATRRWRFPTGATSTRSGRRPSCTR